MTSINQSNFICIAYFTAVDTIRFTDIITYWSEMMQYVIILLSQK
uniref:Uncharacterized protein n=1 Tax=Anguilla anguilla TaxID=7936 RepID=A0A0E9PDM9_ANGAN